MKTLQHILLIIICISGVFVSVSYLLPRKIRVERSLVIDASAKSVFDKLNTLKSWDKWSPWLTLDKNAQIGFSGPESGIGAKIEWISKNKNIGNGTAFIIGCLPNDSISFILDFGKKGKSTGCFRFVKENQGTKVLWSIETDLGLNPISRWVGLLSDRLVGPDLEKGLLNIDTLMHSIQSLNKYEVLEIEVATHVLLSMRDTASPATMNQKMTMMFEKISKFLKLHHLSPTAAPTTIFHTFAATKFDIETCIPISSVVSAPHWLNCYEVAAQKAIMVKHFGSYKRITEAYDAIQTYLKDENMEVNGSGWEEYITNPYLEADSSKWQTNIYFPVK